MICSDEIKQFCRPLGNTNLEAEVQKQQSIVGLGTRELVKPPERAAHMIEVKNLGYLLLF